MENTTQFYVNTLRNGNGLDIYHHLKNQNLAISELTTWDADSMQAMVEIMSETLPELIIPAINIETGMQHKVHFIYTYMSGIPIVELKIV